MPLPQMPTRCAEADSPTDGLVACEVRKGRTESDAGAICRPAVTRKYGESGRRPKEQFFVSLRAKAARALQPELGQFASARSSKSQSIHPARLFQFVISRAIRANGVCVFRIPARILRSCCAGSASHAD